MLVVLLKETAILYSWSFCWR